MSKAKKSFVFLLLGCFFACMAAFGILFSPPAFAAETGVVSADKYAEFRDSVTGEAVGAGWGNVATNMTQNNGSCAQPDPNHAGNVDIVTDLGRDIGGVAQSVSEYLISEVYINWDATNYSSDYEIQISLDDEKYTTVASVTGHTSGPKATSFTEAQARYVRIAVKNVVCAPGMPYGVWGMTITGREVPGAVNLAAGKPVLVDGAEQTSALTDASASTAYTAAEIFDAVVYFGGLVQTQEIVLVNPSENYVTEADLFYSDDLKNWNSYAAGVTLAAGENTLPAQTASMRYLKISAKKSSGSEFSLADVRVSGIVLSEDKNVALQKGAEIFYPEGQTGGVWGDAWKMNDGDASTYAQGTTNHAVMQMDLRNIFRIDRLGLQFYPDGRATAFKIEGSFDGMSWEELASTESAAESNVFLLSEKAAVRYVRLTVTESTAAAYAVTEWEVYGTAETNLANADNTRAVILETGDSVTMWDTQPLRNAFDDDDATLAQSNTNVPWDLVTDLGGYYSVSAVRYLGDHANKIAKGSLEFSNNGVTFEKLFDINAETIDEYNHFCIYYPEDLVARYIRLNVEEVQGGGADYGHAVGNFAVYGTPAEKPQIDAESVSILNKEDIPEMMYPGDTFKLQLSLGNNLSADAIVWTSSNPKRLEVSADGTVTAKVLGGTFTVTVQVGDATDTAEFSVYRVINVASRSLVTMENGTPGWGHVASHVVDGDENSICQTIGNTAYSLVIDMYGELKIGRVVVYTHDGPPSFTLSISSDGKVYTQVEAVESAQSYTKYEFDWEDEGGKTFRYLKFSGEKLPLEGIDYGYSIKEIEVYNHTTQSLDNLPEAPVPDNGPWAGDEWQLPAGEGQNEVSAYPDTKFGLGGAPESSPYPEQAGTDTAAIVLVSVFAALAVAACAVTAVYFIKARKPEKEENDE